MQENQPLRRSGGEEFAEGGGVGDGAGASAIGGGEFFEGDEVDVGPGVAVIIDEVGGGWRVSEERGDVVAESPECGLGGSDEAARDGDDELFEADGERGGVEGTLGDERNEGLALLADGEAVRADEDGLAAECGHGGLRRKQGTGGRQGIRHQASGIRHQKRQFNAEAQSRRGRSERRKRGVRRRGGQEKKEREEVAKWRSKRQRSRKDRFQI
jgi:hypothetical protein